MRYFLKLSFNGKNYHGWQVQQNAHAVQAELEKALSVFMKEEIHTIGCGRTDTGVHAKVFYAHFDTTSEVQDHEYFIHHLNCLLPHDIAVHQLVKVEPDDDTLLHSILAISSANNSDEHSLLASTIIGFIYV